MKNKIFYCEYEKINTLKPVAENIWIVDGPVISWNNFPFPTRMTVIKLENNDIFLHSPTPFSDSIKKEIENIGNIKHLVSPNKIHNVFIKEWSEYFPQAIKWASPGVRSHAPEIKFDNDLKSHPEKDWEKEIDQIIFKGSPVMEEVVFFHKSSKTLVLADLIENFEEERIKSHFFKALAKIGGVISPNGKTPLDWRLTFILRNSARQSINKMLEWNPDKIIIAHGKWFENNGLQELKRAFNWLL